MQRSRDVLGSLQDHPGEWHMERLCVLGWSTVEGVGKALHAVRDEEVQAVSEALDAAECIPDPEVRVRAKSRIMAEQVRRNREWGRERKELVLALHDQGLSYRQIAARLELRLSVLQDIFRGYTGSGSHCPKKAGENED